MNAGGIAAVGGTAAASLLALPLVLAGGGIIALSLILKKKSITYKAPMGNKIVKEPTFEIIGRAEICNLKYDENKIEF
jgi:hypothetical protein